MSEIKRDFDKDAETWDENPTRVKLANTICDSIVKHIRLLPDMNVLDFGCGTGLISLNLHAGVHSVTGVDSSNGMLDILNAKITRQGIQNVSTVHLDIDKGEVLCGLYSLVVSSMTLHHIRNIPEILNQFFAVLDDSGAICIADLDSDHGMFHENNDGVYHEGFDREVLEEMFVTAGFKNVYTITATEIEKPAKSGVMSKFTIFLMIGRK
jgi:ubiquinone/menaquinone biosynthesis C-methylase UbiE